MPLQDRPGPAYPLPIAATGITAQTLSLLQLQQPPQLVDARLLRSRTIVVAPLTVLLASVCVSAPESRAASDSHG